jgi:hypothetical protein
VVGTTSWASSAASSGAGPGLHNVRLTGAPTVPIFAGHRRGEVREPVRTLVALLATVEARAAATVGR